MSIQRNSDNSKPGATDPSVKDETEAVMELQMRPGLLAEVIGREKEKQSLNLMISSARSRSDVLDHILFHGPPGLGKTSMAMVIGKEMGVGVHVTTGASITKAGDLVGMITALQAGEILFIDEVHRLRTQIAEILYPAMEDRAIDIVLGKGSGTQNVRIDLPPFTVIGATTKLAMVPGPLRSRFGVDFRLDYYSDTELAEIVSQKSKVLGIAIEPEAALLIAQRARMTPRIAIRILKRVYDLATVTGAKEITAEVVEKTFEILHIDKLGLDRIDRELLLQMHRKFGGRPVGLKTLAAAISEDPQTVEDVYEPYLLKLGFIIRMPNGRILTPAAIDYLNTFI